MKIISNGIEIEKKAAKITRYLGMLAALAAAAMFAAAPAQARDLVYGTFQSPKDGAVIEGMTPYFRDLERASKGAIKWQIAAGGQIASGNATLDAIKSGLMDGGFVISNFVPNVLPSSNLILNTLIFGGDVAATSGAGVETLLLHCPNCIAEYRKVNAVPLIGYSTLPYKLLCRKPVKTVADLKGLKIRAIGSAITLMRLAGVVPVMMSPPATTTALQRGTLDCVDGLASWIRSYGYGAVVKSILDYDLGMASPIALFVINRNTWRGLSSAQRRLYLKHAPATIANVLFKDLYVVQKEVLDAARKRGEITAGGEDFGRLLARFDTVMRADNIIAARKFGVEDSTSVLEAYDKAIAKWQGLSKQIGNSEAKFEAALWREIYSKIDPDRL